MAEYGFDGSQQVLGREPDISAEDAESTASDGAPAPWHRNRLLLALWGLMVALLLTLVIYGIVELSRGGGGETSGPAKSTSSTSSAAPAQSSTTSPTPSTSNTSETPPPSETPAQTPEEVPPPANHSPAPAEPPEHHHHLPHVPSTITLPHTVVTLPHGF
jgi:cell division septation protein DedD